MIQETTEKIILIKQRIQAAHDRQKSYADQKQKPMEFEVGDRVMLKVSPWKGVVQFIKQGKLNPRYIGPFKVLAKIGDVAYRLELPKELSRVHHTFHVSNQKKCYADEPLAMPLEGVHIDETLQFVEELVEIMKREIKRLKLSRIPLVKVRWNSRRGPDEHVFGIICSHLTSIYTDSKPGRVFWGVDEELSDEEPIYPEYIPLEDEHILFAEEQPLPPVISPTTESPGYVAESDPEEDPEEYEEDEAEDGPVDYPMDGGDDGDDEGDDDSLGYDADIEDEDEEEEEEEHLTLADSTVVIPIDELVSPPKETEPTIPPPSTNTTTIGARITIRPRTSISLPPEAEVERLLAMPTPSPSPLPSLSPPSAGERLARCTTPAALPSPPLPPFSYPPPPVDRRDGIPESEQPPRKRLCLSTLGSREVGYGIRDTWIDPVEAVLDMASTTLEKVNTRVAELAELHEHDTQDLYALLEDAQDGRTRISQRVAMDSQRVDLLMGDWMTLRETVWIVEEEASVARKAWAQLVRQIMASITRQGHNPPPPNTNTPPHHMTPKSVQAMIDQALLRNTTNGDGSQSSHEDNPRHVQTTRPCFYDDFMKCHPLNFKGNKGVVGLNRWIKKMESVFNISGCAIENQVKFATCTLLDAALTWWNGQIRTLGPEAYVMTKEVLKKKIMDKYCPQGELKKLEIELWNLKVKGNDVPTYTNRFQELTLTCTKFVANENEKIDKYISGLLDNIYGNVKSSKPRTLDKTIELTNDLMDQKLCTYAERADNKRKTEDTSRNNHGHQQQPFKKKNVTKKCHKCIKVGHFAHDCRSSGNANVANAQRDGKETPKGNGCFECGASGHFKRDCPKLKNKNMGNRNAQGWVYNRHGYVPLKQPLCTISNNGREYRLTVISCSKAQRYMAKGCQTFMAQISARTEEDKSEGKQLKDVLIVRDFPKVFPEDFPGLPPARPVEFQIDLIPGAAPVARASYRLAPSEMKELLEQLQELSDKGFIRPNSSPWGAPNAVCEDGYNQFDELPSFSIGTDEEADSFDDQLDTPDEVEDSSDEEYATMTRQNKNLLDINIDALYNIIKQNQGDVNDVMTSKKKSVVITSNPLALVAEQTKPTNNNLRTSSANKKQEYVKSDDKKEKKKVDEKKRDMSKVKCYNCKKEGHIAKDCKKAKVKDYEYYKTKMLLAKKDKDEQVFLTEDHAWMESSSDSDQEIIANMVFMAQIEKVRSDSEESSLSKEEIIPEQMSSLKPYVLTVILEKIIIDLEDEVMSLLDKKENLKIIESLKSKGCESSENEIFESENQSENDCQVVGKECDNSENSNWKQYATMMRQNKNLLGINIDALYNIIKQNQGDVNDVMKSKKKAVVIASDPLALVAEQTKKFYSKPTNNNLRTSSANKKQEYVKSNGKKEKKKVDEKKRDMSKVKCYNCKKEGHFAKDCKKAKQTSLLKPYVLTVILEKIIIDLEDEVMSLLDKKENLKIIESLKSKGCESSENEISKSENQSENDCQVVGKECDNSENSNVIAPRMFKLNVSQSVSPILVLKTSCASNNVEKKTKRKRRTRNSSKQHDKQVNNDLRTIIDFVHFLDLDTLSSVKIPKPGGVIWKKKGLSNTVKADLSSVNHFDLNKNVKRYSRKDLMLCSNSHLKYTQSAHACNNARNAYCNAMMNAYDDVNDFFFDN
nr:putative reverse transcriptase domain-containing protein [Tanacetum cinerariifolium]